MDSSPSLAICLPTWNRGDLYEACFSSLLRQLDGIDAAIWIFDNGSRAASLGTVERLRTSDHAVFKVYLPRNMGLPYVVNCFCQLIGEGSEYAGHQPPEYVMLADADAYFKAPIRDMIEVLDSNDGYGAVSGHDSEEHETVRRLELHIAGRPIQIKEKEIERGLSLILRAEELRQCYPLPHDTKYNVDWELMKRHPNSLANRNRKVAAVDYVTHLGLYDSTWSPEGVPAGEAEVTEIDSILQELGLLTPGRQEKMKKYFRLRDGGLQPDPRECQPMQNLVLGMHRSGTSVMTRLLSLMGCEVGPPEALLGSNPDNPRGFWERADVLDLNQKLLACFGADAYRVGHFEPESLAGEAVAELEAAGRRILGGFDPDRPSVLKDPRLCLVLRFWKKLLTRPCCVLIHRSPIEVARSLKARHGMPLPYGIALWEKYNLAALEQSRELPRVLVAHADLMRDPVHTVAYLHRELEALGQSGLQMLDRPAIGACIDPDLHRQRCDGAIENDYLNAAQARLLEALRNGDALGWSAIPPLSRQAREILIHYAETIDLVTETAAGPESWGAEIQSRLDAFGGVNERVERQLERLEHLNAQLDQRLENLERQSSEAAREKAELQVERDGLETELRRTASELAERDVAVEDSRRHSSESERQHQAAIARREKWILELDAVISAILGSRSWKLGSTCRELARKLLARPRQPLASDHRRRIMQRFEESRKS